MYAIVKTGGKQYKVAVGDVVEVEKVLGAPGASVALPALIIVFVFEFQASWDDLLRPLIYLGNNVNLYTVPLGLNSLYVQFNPIAGGQGDFQYIVTAALLATIPMILIFVFGQRYFVEGLATQGRKG